MKIAKRDIALIMIVVGAIVAFCSFNFIFKPSSNTVDEEKAKQAELQTKIDEVAKVAGTENQLKEEIGDWSAEIQEMLDRFHAQYSYEDGILWVKNIEEAENSGKPVISQYTIGEAGLLSYSTTVNGQGEFAGKTYSFGTTNYSFSYTVTDYDSLKKFLDYIVNESTRDGVKTINSMTFSVDPVSGAISGSVTMQVYVFTDAENLLNYKLPSIDGVQVGNITNIFGEPTGEEPVPAP